MTKSVFAGIVKKTIPLIGAGVGFAATFFTFKPCCNNLRKVLRDSYLFNKDKKADSDEIIIEAEVVNE